MMYTLPEAVDIDGKSYAINSDYRAVLDIITALSDNELTMPEKLNVTLLIFYEGCIPTNTETAIAECFKFINRGMQTAEKSEPTQKIVDWEKDFAYIADAIMLKSGLDIRGVEHLHWWTFLGYYMNLGDCYFAQIVAIRKKLKKGKKLDETDREFYKNNKEIINLTVEETEEEKALLAEWIGGV